MSTFLRVEAVEIVCGLGLADGLGLGPGPGGGHMRCVVRVSPQGPGLAEVAQPQVSIVTPVILKNNMMCMYIYVLFSFCRSFDLFLQLYCI